MSYDYGKWSASTRKQRRRSPYARWSLLAGMVLMVTFAMVILLKPTHAKDAWAYMWGVMLPLILGSSMSPFTRAAYLTDRGFSIFDEFERAALLTALRRSYLVVLLTLVTFFAWLTFGARYGWLVPTTSGQWLVVGGALICIIAALPVTFAEFTVPMPDPEDEPI